MRRIVFGITTAISLLIVGVVAWNAGATIPPGATSVPSGPYYSLVELRCSCPKCPWKVDGTWKCLDPCPDRRMCR